MKVGRREEEEEGGEKVQDKVERLGENGGGGGGVEERENPKEENPKTKAGEEEEKEVGEEVQDKGVRPEGKLRTGGGEEEERRIRGKSEDLKVGGAVKVIEETVNNIEKVSVECGRGKRPRLIQQARQHPLKGKPDNEEEVIGVGGVTREAEDEGGTGAKEEPSQGGMVVSAEGTYILKENLTRESLNKKKMGTQGGMEGGRPRDNEGYGPREQGGKQLWDPGSS